MLALEIMRTICNDKIEDALITLNGDTLTKTCQNYFYVDSWYTSEWLLAKYANITSSAVRNHLHPNVNNIKKQYS